MSQETESLLRQVGAILDGHFLLASGRHSPLYVEKFRLLEQPPQTEELCRRIADHFRPQSVQLVAAPTTGGIILSYEVARQLGVRGIFAEKEPALSRSPERSEGAAKGEGEGFRLRRGFRVAPGERTLVVDDVLTTGGSIREVIEAVRAAGGQPIGVGVLVDRTSGRTDFGLPFFSCLTLDFPAYDPADCPLCARQVSLTVT
ncbi:MAG: orotate phosphoribosyltransferase [Chloroflexota bacterium]|nr:orotate phosphoribosyltransferase [Chloroflexota bacterium]